jgi:hypothetical protein
LEQPGLGRESTLWLGNHVEIGELFDLAIFARQSRVVGGPEHAAVSGARPTGFYVSCLPVKIKGASAGWCRAVALLPP